MNVEVPRATRTLWNKDRRQPPSMNSKVQQPNETSKIVDLQQHGGLKAE